MGGGADEGELSAVSVRVNELMAMGSIVYLGNLGNRVVRIDNLRGVQLLLCNLRSFDTTAILAWSLDYFIFSSSSGLKF